MFKTITLTFLLSTTLFGGLLDFQKLEHAKSSYEEGKYSESVQQYNAVDDKSDALHYNVGNAYYKDKKYDKAIAEFKQVQTPELKPKALHNMGNAYAQSKKVDEAIKAYEEALKLSDDEDTQFNLDLLKKEKKKQQKQDKKDQNDQDKKDQQNQDKKDQKKKDQQNQDKKDQKQNDKKSKDQQKNDQKSQDQKDQKSKENQENKQKEKSKEQEAKEKKEREEKAKEEKKKKEEAEAAQGEPKALPISDMQERKYEKMLDKRGIKTLMVPLKTQGGHDDETTAW